MKDYMIRAIGAGAQIRAFAATTKETVETARKNHNTSPVMTAALGRLLTAGAMMGSMLKGEKDILTLQIKGDGPGKGLVVTADSQGSVKGYAITPQVIIPANGAGKLDVGAAMGNGMLNVIKDMGLKEPYVGRAALQTGEIGDDLTYYFAVSEQVPSSVGLGVLMERNNTVKQAGGFIVQLMPFAKESVVARLEENLANIASVTSLLDAGKGPEEIVGLLLEGLELEILDKMPVEFRCDCNKKRVEKALISLGKKEVGEMIAENKPVEVGCHFCGTDYTFSAKELKEIMKKAQGGET